MKRREQLPTHLLVTLGGDDDIIMSSIAGDDDIIM
ncbi:hypothetical protein SAMN04489719_1108 [Agrococcus carbonis]|uniref:Uncharacterized protein n=1 Tax=Agrococcus carbonis TaxID=684552 RepID=A0A1H1MXZ8_9MICO|nr:hypothetical protein SAMN04489719_1108 [Agrococcus carbonis]